ncbi:hypothetical protein ABZ826_34360 [Streptomyces sp. NPDC047515]|uniref:hypothetical protein n=1 Tax=Streptomyces sp. NPDC047515 TaxID=3155380 RepID=UPI0033E41646
MLTLLAVGPWVTRIFGSEGEVASAGALHLRCVGPYLVLLACFIAWGGVRGQRRQWRPRADRHVRRGLQLALAYALSGSGLPGVRLAMALSMALRCTVVARMYRRTDRPTATHCDSGGPKDSATEPGDTAPTDRFA